MWAWWQPILEHQWCYVSANTTENQDEDDTVSLTGSLKASPIMMTDFPAWPRPVSNLWTCTERNTVKWVQYVGTVSFCKGNMEQLLKLISKFCGSCYDFHQLQNSSKYKKVLWAGSWHTYFVLHRLIQRLIMKKKHLSSWWQNITFHIPVVVL